MLCIDYIHCTGPVQLFTDRLSGPALCIHFDAQIRRWRTPMRLLACKCVCDVIRILVMRSLNYIVTMLVKYFHDSL